MVGDTLRPLFVEGAGFTDETFNEFIHENIFNYKHYVFIHNSSVTAKTNKKFNYEYFEIVGDALLNHLAVKWITNKYPQYRNAEGVQVIAQLKMKIISTNSWSDFASKNQFHTIIDAAPDFLFNIPNTVLEDIFEAFFGFTETILGFDVCERIFNYMLRDFHPSTDYDDLYNPIQRLIQLKNKFKFSLREVCQPMNSKKTCYVYFKQEGKAPNTIYGHVFTRQKHTIHYIDNDNEILIGNGDGDKLADARRIASEQAINCLAELGYTLDVPDIYEGAKPPFSPQDGGAKPPLSPSTKQEPSTKKKREVFTEEDFPALGAPPLKKRS